ncbi:MAG TPA: hypothetical protein DCS93_11925 [Microscillaceae bacterium]|nr:hypothetical protein [Microscillaceae bacterium]
MKFIFLLVTTLLISCWNNAQSQGKIWRTIKLDSFPNTAFTARQGDFREVLVKGVLKREIQAYKRTGNFADFSQPFTVEELRFRLKQYETAVETLVDVRPEDFHTIELQESYDFTAKNKLPKDRYTIKSLALFTSNLEWQYLTLMFRYEDVKKYLENMFENSNKAKNFPFFVASWQSPTNPFLQIPITKALEERLFISEITETSHLSSALTHQISQEKPVIQLSDKSLLFHPIFFKENSSCLHTKVGYRLDLKDSSNAFLFQKGEGLIKSIVKGVQQQKIKPYHYSDYWDKASIKPMKSGYYDEYYTSGGFLGHRRYYSDEIQDSVDIPLKNITQISVLGWLTIDKHRQTRQFKATRLILWLPGKTHSALSWPFFWAQFGFKVLEKYWNVDQRQLGVWSNKQNTSSDDLREIGQLNFANIIQEGAFKGEIEWFLNRRDENIEQLWKRYLKKNKIEAKEFPLSKARQWVQLYLNRLTKGIAISTKK